MPQGAVARRYAAAIFDLARKQNTLERTLEDVEHIAEVFANRKISYLLREPKIPNRRKEQALRQALASRVQPTSLNLALLVVQRELVEAMPTIANELEKLVRDYRNEAVAQVTTAAPMDDAEQADVRRALEHRTGKTIIVQPSVDKAILGGVIARVGDEIIDGSVRYRLSVLQQQLLTDVSGSNTSFLSPQELADTAQAIHAAVDNVDTENTQIDEYSTVPGVAYNNVPAAGPDNSGSQEGYNSVPDAQPPVYRS